MYLEQKAIWTLLVGEKYPEWYPAQLAKNLEPYGVTLYCLTEPGRKLEPWKNLIPWWITPSMTEGCSHELTGAWWIMVFFNGNWEPGRLLFVDVDTIFLRSPEPIFEHIERYQGIEPYIAHRTPMSWFQKPIGQVGPLAYLDRAMPETRKIWHDFCNLCERPKGDRISRGYLWKAIPPGFAYWPIHFMVGYKVLANTNDEGRASHPCSKYYQEQATDKPIALTFSGEPSKEQVVREKWPGYTMIEKYVYGRENDF